MQPRSAQEIQQSTEKLLRDLNAVVEDGEELLRSGAEALGERGQAAKEKLTAALDAAKETQRRLREQVVAGAQRADRLVREYPYQAIGISFGVGLLIGVLANRK